MPAGSLPNAVLVGAKTVKGPAPRQLSERIDRLLAKTPGDRPQSAQEVVALLEMAELACRQSGLSPSGERRLPAAAPHAVDVTAEATWAEPRLGYERSTRTGTSADRQRQLGERRQVTVVCCGLASSSCWPTVSAWPAPAPDRRS